MVHELMVHESIVSAALAAGQELFRIVKVISLDLPRSWLIDVTVRLLTRSTHLWTRGFTGPPERVRSLVSQLCYVHCAVIPGGIFIALGLGSR